MDGVVMAGNTVGSVGGMVDLMVDLRTPLHQQLLHQQHLHQNQNFLAPHHQHLQEMVPLPVGQHMGGAHESEQSVEFLEFKGSSMNLMNCNKGKPCASEDDEPSFAEDGTDGHHNGEKDERNSPWQRMKWTDDMVRLLIKVVCYVDDDPGLECTNENRQKSGFLQKKGKWKSVSTIMTEKGFSVSPQQCEDKFNDLNKRYKKLNDKLGRGTSCKVVENPALLDSMDHLPKKTKEDVRKILCSKHLFYEEMCSYHNGNRLHITSDLGMQSSTPKSRDLGMQSSTPKSRDLGMQSSTPKSRDLGMQSSTPKSRDLGMQSSTPKSRDDHEGWWAMRDENGGDDEDDEDNENNDEVGEDNYDENDQDAGTEGIGFFPKRMKASKKSEGASYWTLGNLHKCMRSSAPENLKPMMSGMLPNNARPAWMQPDNARTEWMQRQWMRIRKLQLKERKVDLQAQAFELEKERFKWQKISSKKDRELERLNLENEKMKLENEHMALQLNRKLETESNRS